MVTAESDSRDTPEMFTGEWVAWLDSVLAECPVSDAVDLVLEHRVSSEDGSVFCWHVRVAEGRVSAAAGPAETGSAETGSGGDVVSFASDRETARAIALEGKSAQRAFAEGRLRLGGDAQLLIAARPAMEAVGAALRPRR